MVVACYGLAILGRSCAVLGVARGPLREHSGEDCIVSLCCRQSLTAPFRSVRTCHMHRSPVHVHVACCDEASFSFVIRYRSCAL